MRTETSLDSRPGEGARRHPPDVVVSPPVSGSRSPGTWSERFTAGYAELSSRQKPGAGVPAYMRWVNRRAARPFAAAAYATGMTPNAVTAISGLVSLVGLVVLVVAEPSVLTGVVVAVLLALGFALDSADGQLARLSGSSGPAGEWLDHVVDAVRAPSVHVAVGAALYLGGERGGLLLLPLAFVLLTVVQFFSQILAEQLARSAGQAAEPASGGTLKSFLLLPVDTGVTCWLFVLWGVPAVFVVCYAALFVFTLVHTAASMVRKYTSLRAIGASA